MKVLITGSSGFIGTNLVDRLFNEGHDCRLIDILSPRVKRHLGSFREVDIRDFNALEEVYFDFCPEIIFHLAARTDLNGKSLSDYDANVAGVDNICRLLLDDRVDCVGIFVSSMLVCSAGHIPKDSTDFCPPNLYGESKVLGEKIVRSLLDGNVDYRILRPTSIWGPWFGEPYRFFFQHILDRRFFKINGVQGVKTYGFIDNAVSQIIASVDSYYTSSTVYYLGDKTPMGVNDWADRITNILGRRKCVTLPYKLVKLIAILGDLVGLIGISFPLTSFRLQNMSTNNIIPPEFLVGIESSSVGLDDGIAKTVRWLQNEN